MDGKEKPSTMVSATYRHKAVPMSHCPETDGQRGSGVKLPAKQAADHYPNT